MSYTKISKENYLKMYQYNEINYWSRKLNKDSLSFDLELIGQEKKKIDKLNLFKNNIDNINLETSSYCNRKCGYCPVSKYGRNYKNIIDEKLLDYILENLKSIDYNKGITLNLYNEPLADKNFTHHLDKISKCLPNAFIFSNSNGDYVKSIKDLLKLEDAGLKKLKITLHAPRNSVWNRDFMINSLKKFAKRINFDLDKKHYENLEFCFKLDSLYCIVQCPNWFEDGNYRGGSISYNKTQFLRNQPCVKPFREFTIYYDGSITQCCDIYYGNNSRKNKIETIDPINKVSIYDIYVSKKMSKIRRELFDWSDKSDACSNCSSKDLSTKSDDKLRKNILNKLFN